MVLTDLKIGEYAVIERFDNAQIELLLTDMGCPKGTRIQLYQKAFSQGPISIKTASGNLLAIRYKEAKHLILSKK